MHERFSGPPGDISTQVYIQPASKFVGPVLVRDLSEEFPSVDAMLEDAVSWAKGGYRVDSAGSSYTFGKPKGQFENRIGHLEVTWDDGLKWFPHWLTYTYQPDPYQKYVSPPKCFSMYEPERLGDDRWRLTKRGEKARGTVTFIHQRAVRLGYVEAGEGRFTMRGHELVTTWTHGMKGGPQIVIEHRPVKK